jgi:hypothetical protein
MIQSELRGNPSVDKLALGDTSLPHPTVEQEFGENSLRCENMEQTLASSNSSRNLILHWEPSQPGFKHSTGCCHVMPCSSDFLENQ